MSIESDMLRFWNKPTVFEAKQVISSPYAWEEEIPIHTNLIFRECPYVASLLGTQLLDVVEIGCGIGRLIKPVTGWNWKLTGLDISSEMLRFAKEYLFGLSPEPKLVQLGTDGKIPLTDNSQNLVYSMMVFQHLPTRTLITSYLKESLRCLKPGGLIRVQTHRGGPAKAGEFGGFRGHMYMSSEEFAREFRAAGFEVVTQKDGLGYKEWLWVTGRKP